MCKTLGAHYGVGTHARAMYPHTAVSRAILPEVVIAQGRSSDSLCVGVGRREKSVKGQGIGVIMTDAQ